MSSFCAGSSPSKRGDTCALLRHAGQFSARQRIKGANPWPLFLCCIQWRKTNTEEEKKKRRARRRTRRRTRRRRRRRKAFLWELFADNKQKQKSNKKKINQCTLLGVLSFLSWTPFFFSFAFCPFALLCGQLLRWWFCLLHLHHLLAEASNTKTKPPLFLCLWLFFFFCVCVELCCCLVL